VIRRRPTLVVTAIIYKVPSASHSTPYVSLLPALFPLKDEFLSPTFGGCRDAVSHSVSHLFWVAFSTELFLPFHVVRITLFPFDLYCVCPSHVRFPHGVRPIVDFDNYCTLLCFWWMSPNFNSRGIHVPFGVFRGRYCSHVKPLILSYATVLETPAPRSILSVSETRGTGLQNEYYELGSAVPVSYFILQTHACFFFRFVFGCTKQGYSLLVPAFTTHTP
jgi:hypothetical protein